MNGAQHYREAEALLADGSGPAEEALWRAIKAVGHATLASTAATLECATEHPDESMRHIQGNHITQGKTASEWQEAIS